MFLDWSLLCNLYRLLHVIFISIIFCCYSNNYTNQSINNPSMTKMLCFFWFLSNSISWRLDNNDWCCIAWWEMKWTVIVTLRTLKCLCYHNYYLWVALHMIRSGTTMLNTDWCKCGYCMIMPTLQECLCCREIDQADAKRETGEPVPECTMLECLHYTEFPLVSITALWMSIYMWYRAVSRDSGNSVYASMCVQTTPYI